MDFSKYKVQEGTGELKPAKLTAGLIRMQQEEMKKKTGKEYSEGHANFNTMTQNLKRLKKKYEEIVSSGGDKEQARKYADAYNSLLDRAKKYLLENRSAMLKASKIKNKYLPQIKRAMDIDASMREIFDEEE